jgi:hypothetical protein
VVVAAGSRKIEHLGSAHDEAGVEMLKAAGRQRIAAGQAELDLGLEPAGGGPLPITSSRMGCLLDALGRGYRVLGLDAAAGGGEVFGDLVLARIIEPVSRLDSLRVLEEAGVAPASYRTVERRLPVYAQQEWRSGCRKFVKTARRYRTIQIHAGQHTVTTAGPLPDELRLAIDAVNRIG